MGEAYDWTSSRGGCGGWVWERPPPFDRPLCPLMAWPSKISCSVQEALGVILLDDGRFSPAPAWGMEYSLDNC